METFSLLRWLLLAALVAKTIADCASQNFCNGHGTCQNTTSTCVCYDGWGSSNDVAFYKAPDCSLRTCPSDRAWADIPSSPTTAHAIMECSNRGVCNRQTGTCTCFEGFTGAACQRTKCPNDCSGHGVCVSLKQMARMSNALPLAPNTYYEAAEDGSTWDEDMIYGCVCDSSWTVGLGSGEVQEPEWFGPDCSFRKSCAFTSYSSARANVFICWCLFVGHCPSADNPRTSVDETNCTSVVAANSIYAGERGNLCHVDCANQGLCDYRTGTCKCFDGQYGSACAVTDPTAVYSHWRTDSSAPVTTYDDDL